jgi:hypothetical protein
VEVLRLEEDEEGNKTEYTRVRMIAAEVRRG